MAKNFKDMLIFKSKTNNHHQKDKTDSNQNSMDIYQELPDELSESNSKEILQQQASFHSNDTQDI